MSYGLIVSPLFATLMVAGCASPSNAGENWRERADRTCGQRLAQPAVRGRASHDAGLWRGEWAVAGLGRDKSCPTRHRVETREGRTAETELSVFRLAADHPQIPAEASPAAQAEAEPAQPPATAPTAVERGPLPGFGETVKRDLQELPHVLWHDSKAAFANPWNLVLLGAAGGASIALRTTNADDHVAEHYDRHNTFSGDWPDTFATLGNPGTHFALAGVWYLAGQQLQDAKTYEVGRKLFSALTITGVSTMFLKVAAWDDSPNGEWGAWPSGHVSSTMAMATVLNGAYGPLVGVPMFGLTALVGIERLDDREHWLSDVIFGAALGWVVGETVFKEHRPEIFGGEVVPYVDPVNGGAGIGWLKTLGND